MRSDHADWKPVPYQGLHKRQPHRAAIIHTNGGPATAGSLYGWWCQLARKGQHIGAHFQVKWDGTVEQYVDTDLVIYHAYDASEWAIGIEVQDDGHPERPMTPAQVGAILDLLHEHHIPGQLLQDGPSDGVGFHEQYPDWNRDGHTCPGSVRRQQVIDTIIPSLGDSLMPTADEVADAVLTRLGLDPASLARLGMPPSLHLGDILLRLANYVAGYGDNQAFNAHNLGHPAPQPAQEKP